MRDFFQLGRASVIVGGQYGSEAKGLAAAWVSERAKHVSEDDWLVCTTNAGAQAGHTTVLSNGLKFVCYHLPTVGVMRNNSTIYINAGSIINRAMLEAEIEHVCAVMGENPDHMRGRIVIDPRAGIINDEHQRAEATLMTHMGSTRKGIGAALADKVLRKHESIAYDHVDATGKVAGCAVLKLNLAQLMESEKYAVSVEIPQGTSLSINNGHEFPHCTSRDCWVGQGLTDAGIHPYYLSNTLMVVRSFPIRVGHILDETGQRIGDSGPFFRDSRELDWTIDFPGIVPEITTVTKRVRRIATFSQLQYMQSLVLNRPTHVLYTFCNYLKSREALSDWVDEMRMLHRKTQISPHTFYSFGPKTNQVHDQWMTVPYDK